MTIDSQDLLLFDEWKAARKLENAAVMALHEALKNGAHDELTLESLKFQMDDAHNKAMDIYDRLKHRKLENP